MRLRNLEAKVWNMALKVADANLRYTPVGSLDEAMSREALDYQIEMLEERRGTAREHEAVWGSVSATVYQGSTYRIPPELVREWPEVIAISTKLIRREELDERDRLWIEEMAKASGWSVDDIVEELENLDIDPPERVERYRSLFENYYREALKHKMEGDTRQAGEKIWGAVTALVKLYAALRGIFIAHWGLNKLYNFVENNVEARHREIFMELLDRAFILHVHFYEAHLGPESFEKEWRKVVDLIEKAREIVFKQLPREAKTGG